VGLDYFEDELGVLCWTTRKILPPLVQKWCHR